MGLDGLTAFRAGADSGGVEFFMGTALVAF